MAIYLTVYAQGTVFSNFQAAIVMQAAGKQAKKNGLGRYSYADGSWYFGQFVDNAMCGYGVYYDGCYHIGLFENDETVTESHVAENMIDFKQVDADDGGIFAYSPATGYSIFRNDKEVIYLKDEPAWIARYNDDRKSMEMGMFDEHNRLNDEKAIKLDIDKALAIGPVHHGIPSGKTTIYYATGDVVEVIIKDGEPEKFLREKDKFGNVKEYNADKK